MLVVLSPAKRLLEGPAIPTLAHSQPELLDEAESLVHIAQGLDAAGLKGLMGISDKLADLNAERFQAWHRPFTTDNSRQAARIFAGDTYLGFDAASLSADDLQWAQDRVGILSGLYGLLRPLDLVQPYRLEMGTRLATERGKNLYAWWGTRLADLIGERTQGHVDRTLVNLASPEYGKAVDRSALAVPLITPAFKEIKNGESRTLGLFAKKARGMMARWVVEHRVERAEELKGFTAGGYAYNEAESDAQRWVFDRPQPPPVGER